AEGKQGRAHDSKGGKSAKKPQLLSAHHHQPEEGVEHDRKQQRWQGVGGRAQQVQPLRADEVNGRIGGVHAASCWAWTESVRARKAVSRSAAATSSSSMDSSVASSARIV